MAAIHVYCLQANDSCLLVHDLHAEDYCLLYDLHADDPDLIVHDLHVDEFCLLVHDLQADDPCLLVHDLQADDNFLFAHGLQADDTLPSPLHSPRTLTFLLFHWQFAFLSHLQWWFLTMVFIFMMWTYQLLIALYRHKWYRNSLDITNPSDLNWDRGRYSLPRVYHTLLHSEAVGSSRSIASEWCHSNPHRPLVWSSWPESWWKLTSEFILL